MATQPETVFKKKVLKDLQSIGCWSFKVESGSVRGIPDVMICRNGWFVALELKKDTKAKLRPLQGYNISKIRHNGGLAFITYPENWDNVLDKIKSVTAVQ